MNSNDEPKIIYECPYCGRSYASQANCIECIKSCKTKNEGREFTFCTEVTIDIFYSDDDDKYDYELTHEQHPGYVYKDRPDKFEATDTGDMFTLNAVSAFNDGLGSIRGLRYCYVNDKRIHSDAEIKKMLVAAAKKNSRKYRRRYNHG